MGFVSGNVSAVLSLKASTLIVAGTDIPPSIPDTQRSSFQLYSEMSGYKHNRVFILLLLS